MNLLLLGIFAFLYVAGFVLIAHFGFGIKELKGGKALIFILVLFVSLNIIFLPLILCTNIFSQ